MPSALQPPPMWDALPQRGIPQGFCRVMTADRQWKLIRETDKAQFAAWVRQEIDRQAAERRKEIRRDQFRSIR